MRCEELTVRRLEHELGELDEDASVRLERHLQSCAACRRRAAMEQRISEGLSGMRSLNAPHVDVVARVGARIAGLRPFDRGPLPGRTLGWAIACAFALLAVLVGAAAALAPSIAEAWPTAKALGAGLLAATFAVGRSVVIVVEPFVALVVDAASGVLRRLADPDQRAMGHALVLTAFVLSIGMSGWLVGRDLASSSSAPSKET